MEENAHTFDVYIEFICILQCKTDRGRWTKWASMAFNPQIYPSKVLTDLTH